MKNARMLKLILLVSGLLAIIIGGAILFAPAVFYAAYGIDLVGDANLSSEIRAPGGALLATGLLMLAGAFVQRLALASTIIAAAVYPVLWAFPPLQYGHRWNARCQSRGSNRYRVDHWGTEPVCPSALLDLRLTRWVAVGPRGWGCRSAVTRFVWPPHPQMDLRSCPGVTPSSRFSVEVR